MKNFTLAHRALLGLAALAAAGTAHGSSVSYSFSSGTRAASANFAVTAGQLVVTLTNTSSYDVLVPTDVLTAVYFDWQAPPIYPGGFIPVSAVLGAGSIVYNGPQPADGNVGGEWAYSGVSGSVTPGISSTGLSAYGPGDLFGGPNLQGPASPGGLQYGIASAGDNPATGNGGVMGNALIRNQVIFTLNPNQAIDATFLQRLLNVRVQYGTSASEPSFTLDPLTVIPLPPAAWAGLSTLAGVGLIGFVRRRKNAAQ